MASIYLPAIELGLNNVDGKTLGTTYSPAIDCRGFKAVQVFFNCDITGAPGTAGEAQLGIVHYGQQDQTEGLGEGWNPWTGLNTYTTNGEQLSVAPGTQLATGGVIIAAQVATLISPVFIKFGITIAVVSDAATSACRMSIAAVR